MQSPYRKSVPVAPTPLEIRVCSADCEPMADGDVRRLFPGSSLTDQRLDRLRQLPRVAVMIGGRVVGTATCVKADMEMRVPDLGVDGELPRFGSPAAPADRDIIHALLDAIEMAALAAGCIRIVLNPPKVSLALLERRGYREVRESCAGAWVEKTVF